MVAVAWREQREVAAVEVDAIEVNKIGVAALFAAYAETNRVRAFSSMRAICVTFQSPLVIWFFNCAGRQVV